jgi:hypothetical protein
MIEPLIFFAAVMVVLLVGTLVLAAFVLRAVIVIGIAMLKLPFRVARRTLMGPRQPMPPPVPVFTPQLVVQPIAAVDSYEQHPCPNRLCRHRNPGHARFCSHCGVSCVRNRNPEPVYTRPYYARTA